MPYTELFISTTLKLECNFTVVTTWESRICHILHEAAPLVCLETSVKQNTTLTKNIQNQVYYEPDKNCCT